MGEETALEPWPVEGMTEAEAEERWPNQPRNERVKRAKLSVQAKERHAQIADPDTGRRVFGGPQPGSGRPRKRRIAEEVAELASGDRQPQVIEALFSGLKRSQPAPVRVRTAKEIIRIEREERELQLREDRAERMSDTELALELAKRLAQKQKRGELPAVDKLGDARREYDAEGSAEEDHGDSAAA